MAQLIVILGAVTAVAAAARSTWSPCGLSMLSSITPFSERGRGHRYRVTAAWFVAGATAGGATLGAVSAGLAALVGAAGLGSDSGAVLVIAALAAMGALVIDTGVAGDWLPLWRRQVNDRWLSTYRSWVYGSGFGWQIGAGVTTYIMTAAVFLTVVLAVLTGTPATALVLCTVFGFTRGLAVLLTSRAASPEDLHRLHRRLERAGPLVRQAVIAVEIAVAGLALGWLWPLAGVGLAAAGGACEVLGARRRALRAKQCPVRTPAATGADRFAEG